MYLRVHRFVALLQFCFFACALAQVEIKQPALRQTQVDLTHSERLPGLPATGAFAYPFSCASDGVLYAGELVFDQEGRAVSTIPDLYSVSRFGTVKLIPRPLPTNTYKQVDSPSFFAAGSSLATLIRASKLTDQSGIVHPGTDFFLSITDPEGDHPKLIQLHLEFNAAKVAVFGSGDFIAVGLDRTTFEPVAALLGPDGQLRRYLDVFPRADGVEKDPASESTRKHDLTLSIGAVQFAPWGDDILMTAPGTDTSSVYHFRAGGQVERVRIKLPGDQQVAGILGSGGRDTWVIRTRSAEAAKMMAKVHVLENPEEFLYEVNPVNGELLRELDVKGPLPAEVACAADGKLTAIYAGGVQQGAPDQLVLASTTR
jgi:hypothetical protein